MAGFAASGFPNTLRDPFLFAQRGGKEGDHPIRFPMIAATQDNSMAAVDTRTLIHFGLYQLEKNNSAKSGVILPGTPKGIRTPVAALKGLSPSPLDDGGTPIFRNNDNGQLCRRELGNRSARLRYVDR